MAYRIPAMPLSVNIWRVGSVVANPPDVVSPACLSPGRREMVVPALFTFSAGTVIQHRVDFARGFLISMELLLPKGTDIRSYVDPDQAGDCVECPAGSGRYYAVYMVDDVAKGFPNEYRLALMLQLTPGMAILFANPWAAPAQAWPMP